MLVDGAIYEDIEGRVFKINIVRNDVHISIIEGNPFRKNPISKKQAKAWKKGGFWKRRVHRKYDSISKNYNI